MALIAATTGDPVRGATVMFAFGLGTLPAMLGVPFVVSRLTVGVRSNLFRFAAVLVMVVGVQLVLRGLAVGGVVPHAAIGGVTLW
jgi:sulfite exporter TauE/SafE